MTPFDEYNISQLTNQSKGQHTQGYQHGDEDLDLASQYNLWQAS